MARLLDALKQVTLTHVLLLLIAAGLLGNWTELHGINTSLAKASRSLVGIDVDLTTPIDVNIPNAVDVNTEH